MPIFGAFPDQAIYNNNIIIYLYMPTDKTVAQSIVNGLPSIFLDNITTIPGFKFNVSV